MSRPDCAIIGAWKLLSFSLSLVEKPEEPIFRPLGDAPLGRIAFSSNGFMSCLLMPKSNAEPLDTSLWAQASDDDILRVARPFTAYCGPFRTYEENGNAMLSTMVDVSLDPNWIGGPQVRKWSVRSEGGRELLTLQPAQEFVLPDGTRTVGLLVWEKTGQNGKL
ncbi:Lipocalin-like domain-containing protein [Diplogelasinospora grovesii]|uniref:Lipocalin-like domain-containing protein n=1 Tax=Diplogelasinospora grovesii TaxID=303347 RepID=A0AAN6MXZ0_9PEZI|nr:Lipocalin-like domain-containing protein [Diplogelasinospora grovesii]